MHFEYMAQQNIYYKLATRYEGTSANCLLSHDFFVFDNFVHFLPSYRLSCLEFTVFSPNID